MNTIRNRIKAHRRIRAGDLLPHEFNFRTHPQQVELTRLHAEGLECRPHHRGQQVESLELADLGKTAAVLLSK